MSSRPPVELVALDMDGTILQDGTTVDPVAVDAIRSCRDIGVRFVTASGRPRDFQVEILEGHGLQDAFSGLVCDEREIWLPLNGSDDGFDGGVAAFEGLSAWNGRVHDRWATLADEGWRWMEWAIGEAHNRGWWSDVHLSRSEVQERGLAVVATESAETAAELAAVTATRLGSEAPALACNRNGRLVQIHDAQVDKATSVVAVAAALGVEPTRILAVGDSANDLTMLSGAHGMVPATVANADPDVIRTVASAGGRVSSSSFGAGVADILEYAFSSICY